MCQFQGAQEKRRELLLRPEISFFSCWVLKLKGVCRIPDFIRNQELKPKMEQENTRQHEVKFIPFGRLSDHFLKLLAPGLKWSRTGAMGKELVQEMIESARRDKRRLERKMSHIKHCGAFFFHLLPLDNVVEDC